MKARSVAVLFTLPLVMVLPRAGQAQFSTLFLESWGVSYADWTPHTSADTQVNYIVEDWLPGGSAYLGPGYGGDDYDMEAAYFGYDDQNFYLAVVTGFPVSGRYGWAGHNWEFYPPGDIALDFGGDRSFEFAIDVSAGGALRYGNLQWQNPIYHGGQAWGGAADPLRVTSWNASSPISAFRYDTFDGRYAIEAVVARADFSHLAPEEPLDYPVNMHWTMGCGNDVAEVAVIPVPEPPTFLLLVFAGILAGAWRLRRTAVPRKLAR